MSVRCGPSGLVTSCWGDVKWQALEISLQVPTKLGAYLPSNPVVLLSSNTQKKGKLIDTKSCPCRLMAALFKIGKNNEMPIPRCMDKQVVIIGGVPLGENRHGLTIGMNLRVTLSAGSQMQTRAM